MHVDKLDRRIDTDFFDHKATEWREEQRKCLELIREYQNANQTYFGEWYLPARTRTEGQRTVSQAIPSRKTPAAWLRTIELHMEGRSTHGRIPPTV